MAALHHPRLPAAVSAVQVHTAAESLGASQLQAPRKEPEWPSLARDVPCMQAMQQMWPSAGKRLPWLPTVVVVAVGGLREWVLWAEHVP